MGFKLFCKKHGLAFAAGMAAAAIGKKILKSEAVHQATVKAVAKGLSIKDEAQSTINTIKEESQDLYAEAVAEKAKKEAANFKADQEDKAATAAE